MSADDARHGVHDDVRSGSQEDGDQPPPGLESVGRPGAPDNPPEPAFAVRSRRGGEAWNSSTDEGSHGWSQWENDDRDFFSGARDEATQDEWHGSKWSYWDGGDTHLRGSGWDRSRHGDEHPAWDRRSSWDANASTAPGSATDHAWHPRDHDPWASGKDPWSKAWKNDDGFRARQDDWGNLRAAPQADGRDFRERDDDHDGVRDGAWSMARKNDKDGVAWNGWSHFPNGGFDARGARPQGQQAGGRASEKLTVPSFTGDDVDDVGGSARSYLRQVEAWRRMTYLPTSQQGLVLYQHLGGKAWIAAEELSLSRLGSNDGVSYLISWINARFLDLEVARIGRAFSDFFRRLRRKQGQTVREYNTEYDRLHARLREVGCSIPEECAAWLYIDRLALDESQELNLLASVGNTYNLHRLQQAAVLHDRGQRKPWETARGRRTHTPHVTDAPGGTLSDDEGSELEDGVPEDVAVAYATYQSAKERYKEQAKARGYHGERSGDKQKPKVNDAARDEKIKLMKSKSFCNSCGKKGHWHKDPECPNNGNNVRDVEVCHHVPLEVFSLRHDGHSLVGITDTVCAKTVAGTAWLQNYTNQVANVFQKPDLVREAEAFRFGTGKVHHSSFHVTLYFSLGDKVVELKTSVINGDVPLLLSKPALAQLGMVYDVAANKADFGTVGLKAFDLITTSSGHPAIPIVPSRPAQGAARLVISDKGALSSEQYMAFAVSAASLTPPKSPKVATSPATTTVNDDESLQSSSQGPRYKIFYDKKLSPQAKELLSQDRLQEQSFVSWWEQTRFTSDFWLEGEFAWYRIHVVPRRVLCNPSTWKTHSTVQKDMLLSSIGDVRVTEGFCCRSGKPLEITVDRWQEGKNEPSFPMLWIGRSTFAKLGFRAPCRPDLRAPGHVFNMQAAGHQLDEQDSATRRVHAPGPCGAQDLDGGRAESRDPGAQDGERGPPSWPPDEVSDVAQHARAQSEGDGDGHRLPHQRHEGQPAQADSRQFGYAGVRTDEDREVQGLRVPGDSGRLRRVGFEGSPLQQQPACGTGEIREVVGQQPDHDLRGSEDVHRGALRDPLPVLTHGGELGVGRLQRLGDCSRRAEGGHDDEGHLRERLQGTHQREQQEEQRPHLGGRDGCRDGPGDSRGDSSLGSEIGGAERQGEGRYQHRPPRPLNGLDECPGGGLAPLGATTTSEACHLRGGLREHGTCSRPPRGDLPDLHEPSSDQSLQDAYEHAGSQFGGETRVQKNGCCARDDGADRADAFVSAQELFLARSNQSTNLACAPCEDLDHDPFVQAMHDRDYTFNKIRQLLNNAGLKEVKTERGDVFGHTGAMANYNTLGLYTHGGTYGVTTRTKNQGSMVRYINEFARHHLGTEATWTSVTIAQNTETGIHHDYNNLQDSVNHVVSFAQRKGGGLWVEDKDLSQEDANKPGTQWRKDKCGRWMPGKVLDTKEKFVTFNPFYKRATEAWEGDRWCLIFHSTRNFVKIDDNLRKYLKNCGFPLPRRPRRQQAEARRKPTHSARKAIFNNAAKISVMMTTLLTAASTFLAATAYTDVQAEPVVMFEIGGTRGSEEAVSLGKDVFEPMDWKTYESPEGKEVAYHVINGGTPKELRINLDGKKHGCNEAIVDLMHQQVQEGGTVVVAGPAEDSLYYDENYIPFADKYLQYSNDEDGEKFMVFYQKKEEKHTVRGPDRVHQVCAVENNGGERAEEGGPAMDGSGITFGEGTPPMVASALRRLHQNLGHPQAGDMIRHLRLAGCDGPILKAARSLKCQVCDANIGPRIARPSVIPQLCDWNDTVGIDLFYAHDTNDVKHTFLSAVDYGTTYHLAVRVDGQSSDDIEAKFNEMWIVPFGPPKSVVVDLDGGVQGALGRLCDWHNIAMKSIAAQSHWQAGMIERQQAWWKNVWERLVYQLTIGEEEVDLAVPMVNAAKNDLRRRCGHSPSQWVFGRAPRIPEDLRDPDGGERITWDVSEDSKFQRQSAMRAAARIAFHRSQIDSRLRKAFLQRTRTVPRPHEIGESVHFWHKPKNRRRGHWTGPAVIVGREGNNYWISNNGRCRLTSPEHVRGSTPEEVGAYLSMKGTQKEVEKLLEHDPDGSDAFDQDDIDLDEEDLEDMDLDQEDDVVLEPALEEDELPMPTRRLKRKTNVARLDEPEGHEALMLKSDLTRRGIEKRKEKELKWSEIPDEVKHKFREAEQVQWDEHLSYDALQPLSTSESDAVRARIPADRILRCRWAYKDKNWAKRREGDVGAVWRCKSRLVIAGHTDPDLGCEHLSTDAPTLSRSGLACLMQLTANGLHNKDKWGLSAGDIKCAFLTGSYLTRELYMHQPRTGFPGMSPGQLVRIKKNVFGLATSPHEWWGDLQNGFYQVKVYDDDGHEFKFDQCPLDPCIFMLRMWKEDRFLGAPVAYVGCHVDDLLVAAPVSFKDKIESGLSGVFPIDSWEQGEFEFLGSQVRVGEETVEIMQEKYASTRLFHLDIPTGAKDDEAADDELVSDNRSLIGALSWMAAQSRPDLTCAVSMAQQLQKAPSIGDLRFTNATASKATQFKDRGLVFHPVDPDRMMIIVYHDAAWANVPEPDPFEDFYVLTPEDDAAGLQKEGPYANKTDYRKAKKGSSKVASQLGVLVVFADRGALNSEPGSYSIADWKSRAGQRVCRSTFGAETQACAEGLETGQYIRSIFESLVYGYLITVECAQLPILCLSDCRSLYDHLNRQGIPRVPTDKRLAVDLAALRQALKSEMWSNELPIGWIPGSVQKGDILTKPQNPAGWWDGLGEKLVLPLTLGGGCGLISNRKIRQKTSVKLESVYGHMQDGVFPFERLSFNTGEGSSKDTPPR